MASSEIQPVKRTIPTATLSETIRIVTDVIAPTFAKGVIIRRPQVKKVTERNDLEQAGVRYLQNLRNKYKTGPLMLKIPFRSQALILDPDDVHRVLDGSPEPFATASREKISSLSHFQPEAVLISHGAKRTDRRRFNEEVLSTGCPMHELAERFTSVVREEADDLLATARRRGELVYDDFEPTWARVVRRVIFGDDAREDEHLTQMINQLRSDANWAFFKPKRTGLRSEFFRRIDEHLSRAENGSIAELIAKAQKTDVTNPTQQIPHWLFAFDPAGMTTFRTLALLSTHREHAEIAQQEIEEHRDSPAPTLKYMRACILESLRLWPTTPAVLRESTEETAWRTGFMPEETGIFIFAPFFHRDDEKLPYAHTFTPGLWLQKRSNEQWPLIPFSSGPAGCPAQYLVQHVTSVMVARILEQYELRLLTTPDLNPVRPLPGSFNNYTVRFAMRPLTD